MKPSPSLAGRHHTAGRHYTTGARAAARELFLVFRARAVCYGLAVSVLVAIATGILEVTGRVALGRGLTAFFLSYAIIGLALTPIVGLVIGLPRLPRRIVAIARLTRRRLPVPPVVTPRPSPEA